MQKTTINLKTFTCPSCIQKIENALKSLNGIEKDSVEVECKEMIVCAVVEQFAEQDPARITTAAKLQHVEPTSVTRIAEQTPRAFPTYRHGIQAQAMA